jgi:hypothetical protein
MAVLLVLVYTFLASGMQCPWQLYYHPVRAGMHSHRVPAACTCPHSGAARLARQGKLASWQGKHRQCHEPGISRQVYASKQHPQLLDTISRGQLAKAGHTSVPHAKWDLAHYMQHSIMWQGTQLPRHSSPAQPSLAKFSPAHLSGATSQMYGSTLLQLVSSLSWLLAAVRYWA